MFLFRRVLVGDQERVLIIRKGRFERILEAGEYWIPVFGRTLVLERHNVKELEFRSDWAEYIYKHRPGVASRFFTTVETRDSEVAVVYVDGKLSRVIGPGARVMFWTGLASINAAVFDARLEPEAPRDVVAALARLTVTPAHGAGVPAIWAHVEQGKTGLLFIDGRFVRTLAPGMYAFWTAAGAPRVELVDLRVQTIEVPGQEILTKDKVALRVNISATFQITDPVAAKTGLKDSTEYLYRTLQLAVRQTLGKRTLEEVLADKTDVDAAVAADVAREMGSYGVLVSAIALKDIILPGEVREILNQVVTAEKQAQANLIRRREETAATRSLLNTAKLMEGNPILVRLKELETLEKVAEKVDKIAVTGGVDNLLQRLITIEPQ
jgi:regulator of protease activity HflC (stomatin/prohibitin superfamily)